MGLRGVGRAISGTAESPIDIEGGSFDLGQSRGRSGMIYWLVFDVEPTAGGRHELERT
jgi:hypothetical protein